MTVSGLVLTLENDEGSRGRALDELGRDSRITCGEAQGLRLPIVLETKSLTEGESLCETLRNLDGVAFVDVVFLEFSDEVSNLGAC